MPCPICGFCEDEDHKKTSFLCGSCAADKAQAESERALDEYLSEAE